MLEKDKLISFGADKLADIILDVYEADYKTQKKIDKAIVALDDNPKKFFSIIRKEISSLRISKKYIDYHQSDDMVERLDSLRKQISEKAINKSLEYSYEFMLNFLDIHESVFNRTDDSNGSVGEVFRAACKDLAKICQLLNLPQQDVVKLVLSKITANNYGVYDKLIENFRSVLNEEGFIVLRQTMLDLLKKDSQNVVARSALKTIADCQNDVDAFIEACRLGNGPYPYEKLEIVKRLNDSWRSKEALEWLGSIDMKIDRCNEYDYVKLKIESLQLNGDHVDAQRERIRFFESNFFVDIYLQIMKYMKSDEEKEEFKQGVFLKAHDCAQPLRALSFFYEAQFFDECSKLIRNRHQQISGENYYTLRPIVNVLKETDPLSATLLYRRLVEPVLERAKSKYYDFAVKDLLSCQKLSEKIDDWGLFESHIDYFNRIFVAHKNKYSLWQRYEEAKDKSGSA